MKYREPITKKASAGFSFFFAAVVVGLAIGCILRAFQL